jgi:hypothetical protein
MKIVKVWLDEYPENPCSWDNLGTMVCWQAKGEFTKKFHVVNK